MAKKTKKNPTPRTITGSCGEGARKRQTHGAYSLADGGPVQRFVELRIEGLSAARIAEALRSERPDECGSVIEQTVARWMANPRLHVDTILALAENARRSKMPRGTTPESRDRLKQVRELIDLCHQRLTGKLDDDEVGRLKGVRPDTFYRQLLEDERKLSWGDLASIPKSRLQRVVLLVFGELVKELVDRELVSSDRLTAAATDIERAITKRMPDVLRTEATLERVPAKRGRDAGDR